MKFDQNKFDGSCKIIFDEEEIKHLRKNQYIQLTDENLRHFGNNLVRIVSDWNLFFKKEVRELETLSYDVHSKIHDGKIHAITTYIKEYEIQVDEDFKKFIKEHELKKEGENANNFDYTSDLENLKKVVNQKLKKIMLDHNCSLNCCWIQKYYPGNFHSLHVHGNGNNYSFVWFIDCTDKSSNIVFHNPGYPYVVTNSISIKPEINKLLFFDGSVPHMVLPNEDSTRLIISGNCDKL